MARDNLQHQSSIEVSGVMDLGQGLQVAVRQTFHQKMVFDRCLDEEFVRRFWKTPDSIVDQGHPLKLSNATTVTRIALRGVPGMDAHGGESHVQDAVAKRFNPRGPVHSFRHLMLVTRASRNWTYGRMLIAAGIATPRPLVMLEKRWGVFSLHSYVLMEYTEGIPLNEYLHQDRLSAGSLERIALQVADLWWKLDALRITHGDLKPANLIVTPDERLCVIDLDGVTCHRSRWRYRARRKREWWRLMRAWQDRPDVLDAFRSAIAKLSPTAIANSHSIQDPALRDRRRAA